MEHKQYISSGQVVVLLVLARLFFSTVFISQTDPANSIQDTVAAIPAVYLLNFIVAIPILLLQKRHPYCNISQCASFVFGRAAGYIVGVIYYASFFYLSMATISLFDVGYENSVIPNTSDILINIMMIAVCIYGAVKGSETLARFGEITFVYYIVTLCLIIFPVVPQINIGNLKPLFFNGFGIFGKMLYYNYNLSMSVVILSYLSPFMKRDAKPHKIYFAFNTITSLIYAAMLFMIITVLGAFGGKLLFPMEELSTVSKVSSFGHLTTFDITGWIASMVLCSSLFVFMASECIGKTARSGRRLLVVVTSALVFVASLVISDKYIFVRFNLLNDIDTVMVTVTVIFIPLFILAADLIKERVMQGAAQNG